MSALDKNIAAGIERDLSSVYTALVNVSNELYRAAPDHPFLEELGSAIASIEYLPTEQLFDDPREGS